MEVGEGFEQPLHEASEHLPPSEDEATRLENLRLAAIDARIDTDLELGRAQGLVGELEVLADEPPFRERVWRRLMLALYRTTGGRAGRLPGGTATARRGARPQPRPGPAAAPVRDPATGRRPRVPRASLHRGASDGTPARCDPTGAARRPSTDADGRQGRRARAAAGAVGDRPRRRPPDHPALRGGRDRQDPPAGRSVVHRRRAGRRGARRALRASRADPLPRPAPRRRRGDGGPRPSRTTSTMAID